MLKRRAFRGGLFLALCLAFIASLLGGGSYDVAHAAQTVTIDTSRTLTVNGAFQGFGVQEDANMLWTGPNRANGSVVPDDYNTYVKPRLETLKPAFVRKFIDAGWFAYTQGTYTWDSPDMQGLYTDLQTLKDNNVTVILTVWRIPTWLSSNPVNPPVDTESRPAARFPVEGYDDMWSTVMNDFLGHLYGKDGSGYNFTNVKYFGAPNELGDYTDNFPVSRLDTPYTLLSQKLQNAGIPVNLFGPDKGIGEVQTASNDGTLNPLLSFYDYHEYETPVEPNYVSNANTVTGYAAGTGKLVWNTEFGDNNNGNNDWTELPTFAIDGVNHGVAALSAWDLQDQIYDGNSGVLDNGKWGLWGSKGSAYQLKTSFYAWSAITSHTAANSLVYHNSCDTEQCSNLRLAALNDQNGNNTILAYNTDGSNNQAITVNYSGSAPTQTLYRYTLNPTELPDPSVGKVYADGTVDLTNGTFTDTIPAGSFVVYSSLNPTTSLSLSTPRSIPRRACSTTISSTARPVVGALLLVIGVSVSTLVVATPTARPPAEHRMWVTQTGATTTSPVG